MVKKIGHTFFINLIYPRFVIFFWHGGGIIMSKTDICNTYIP